MANRAGRVLVTRPIPQVGIALLEGAGAEVDWATESAVDLPDPNLLMQRAQRADVVVSLLTDPIAEPLLRSCARLRGVANYAVGYDNVDVAAATALGIPVANTPDVLTRTTADFVWALMLGIARRLVEADRFMRAGQYRAWGSELLLGHDVSPGGDGVSKVLGIVGFGRIGRAVARRAHGFDMAVMVHSPGREQAIREAGHEVAESLGALLETSDFVSLHTPLNGATAHLIGAPEFARMKTTAYLVNTSRGPVVDEAALLAALRRGTIAGAALDVYEHEPAMVAGLAKLDNVIVAPHVASATRGTRDQMARLAAANAIAMLRGEPAPNCVNPSVYTTEAWRRRRS